MACGQLMLPLCTFPFALNSAYLVEPKERSLGITLKPLFQPMTSAAEPLRCVD